MFSLEPRRLFATVTPSDVEQYLVELINRARANPTAEASRNGIDLNEGLSPGTISSAAKQPLAINPTITDAARKHSQWMVDNDTFAHTGASGTNPQQRMQNAGYSFTGSWTYGENIAYDGTTGTINVKASTLKNHNGLFTDLEIPGRGHRTNLMNGAFREIGAGIVTGAFNGYNVAMATEDFATSGSSVFLTGVAYVDNDNDDFYTPGEGLPGVTIVATRTSDNAPFAVATSSSGGYSLPLTSGTYNVTAAGTGLTNPISYGNVVIGSQNVKRDFVPGGGGSGSPSTPVDPPASFASVIGGVLTVQGTGAADKITITYAGGAYTVNRNGTASTLSGKDVSKISLDGSDGDDVITLDSSVLVPAYLYGNNGNDKITGGAGNDTLAGGAGKDSVFGGLGDDRLGGNGGHDQMYGEAGKDRLYGGDGNDLLDGGSSTDRLWGEAGNDILYGQSGDDYLYAKDATLDTVYGGTGNDSTQLDLNDTRATIETILS